MKCLVCGREFEGSECDVCKFPIINFPGEDLEAGVKAMQPTILAYRSAFLKKTIIGVTTYCLKINEGKLEALETDDMCFGTVSSAIEGEKWLEPSFDSISKKSSVELSIYIKNDDGYSNRLTVNMPNEQLKNEKKLKFGISINEDLSAVFYAKGENAVSETEPLFIFK